LVGGILDDFATSNNTTSIFQQQNKRCQSLQQADQNGWGKEEVLCDNTQKIDSISCPSYKMTRI
jgi:hypothetical protein